MVGPMLRGFDVSEDSGGRKQNVRMTNCLHCKLDQNVSKLFTLLTTLISASLRKLRTLRDEVKGEGLFRALQYATQAIPRNLAGVQYTRFAPGLYLGTQPNPRGLRLLRFRCITCAVNMREDFDDLAHGIAFQFLAQPALETKDPVRALALGLAFIHEHRAKRESVFIHCASGLHRAGAMAIAYLVSVGWPCDTAEAYLKRRRWGVAVYSEVRGHILKAVELFTAEHQRSGNRTRQLSASTAPPNVIWQRIKGSSAN